MDVSKLQQASIALDEAVWVNGDVHGLSTVKLLVMSRGSKEAQRSVNRALRGLGPEHRDEDGGITDDALDAVDDLTLLGALKGWEGFKDGKKDVPYTPEAAEEFIKSSIFWGALRASVAHVTQQAESTIEALEKN
ncbi:MAG: hypothetical protein AAFM92_03230 [Pseudomonadota bacterium]